MGSELRPFKQSQGRGVGIQCSATSKQTGNRCRRFTGHPGLSVCRFHGGASPATRAAADRRIAHLQPKALRALEEVLTGNDNVARLRAAKYVIKLLGITPANVWKDAKEQLAIEAGGTPSVPVEDEIEALISSLSGTQALENEAV